MNTSTILEFALYITILLILVKPLGLYMANVFQGNPCGLDKWFGKIEYQIYRIAGIEVDEEMNWKVYLKALLIFNLLGVLFVYFIQRVQFYLPLNLQNFSGVPADLAFNTAASFTTNTNWQAYGGEFTLSYFTQMAALTVQNFLSAATGFCVLIALIRGLTRNENDNLGNFWVDMIRSILYILLPLALILSVALASQGVIQNFKPYQSVELMDPVLTNAGSLKNEQTLPMGPVASQVAIKQLGTNGGGFFNVNSAHPFENPTPVTNFLELLAIMLIPVALCYTFGVLVKDRRQGWAILLAMLIIFIPLTLLCVSAELAGNPALTQLGIQGGNMEGKETRFGIANSALWTTATTATANGSTNAMLDSLTPIAGLVPLGLMHLNEVVFGGVGTGLATMIVIIILTVFVSGLMVGRTPEYLGKKIEPFEMKMASLTILFMPLLVLILTAIALLIPEGKSAILNPGPHGLTEVLYAFTSMGSNNGSAFAGLDTNSKFYNMTGGIEMLLLRYWIIIPMLAMAGSLARKKVIPATSGTLPTHTPLFILLIIGVTLIIGALSFFPVLSLGPIVEHLNMRALYGN